MSELLEKLDAFVLDKAFTLGDWSVEEAISVKDMRQFLEEQPEEKPNIDWVTADKALQIFKSEYIGQNQEELWQWAIKQAQQPSEGE